MPTRIISQGHAHFVVVTLFHFPDALEEGVALGDALFRVGVGRNLSTLMMQVVGLRTLRLHAAERRRGQQGRGLKRWYLGQGSCDRRMYGKMRKSDSLRSD